ncbi:MAG TPA: hypothetical protein VGD46_13160 [Rhizobacter sp.]
MSDELDARLSAVERLTLSRQRLRVALHELAPPDEATGEPKEPSVLMTALMAIPGVQTLVESVRGWWAQHPLHLATLVAGSTARSAMRPIAGRNPFGLVLAAAAVGGLLYWIKPWRGLLRPALLAGIVPHLVSRIMAQVPVESWMEAVSTYASEQMRGQRSAESQAATGDGATTRPAAPAAGTTTPVQPQGPADGPSHTVPPTGTLH